MWQALLDVIGRALAFFYDLVGSYGLAIILVVVAVRILMLPLAVRGARAMHQYQTGVAKIQPEFAALKKKYKGDRVKLNEEMMKLYKKHGVSPVPPAGGCLPLVLQLPVLFALFSVLRSTIPVVAVPAEPPNLDAATVDAAFCRPSGELRAEGSSSNTIECDLDGDLRYEVTYDVREWDGDVVRDERAPAYLARCLPREVGEEGARRVEFNCESPVGTRYLPRESALFEDIVENRATFLGMHLSCGATQARSEKDIRFCAPPGTRAATLPLVGYYGLIALMVVSTWYSFKQMQSSTGAQQQPGQQMMAKVMPAFLGLMSLGFPAGVLVYWATTNVWQIGQQYVIIKQREAGEQQASSAQRGSAAKGEANPKDNPKDGPKDGPKPKPPGRKTGGRDGRGRKKRRKR